MDLNTARARLTDSRRSVDLAYERLSRVVDAGQLATAAEWGMPIKELDAALAVAERLAKDLQELPVPGADLEALAAEVHDLVKGLPMVAVHARQVVATSLRRLSEERLCEVVCDAAGLRRGAAGVPAWPPCTPSLVKRVVQHLVDNMEGLYAGGTMFNWDPVEAQQRRLVRAHTPGDPGRSFYVFNPAADHWRFAHLATNADTSRQAVQMILSQLSGLMPLDLAFMPASAGAQPSNSSLLAVLPKGRTQLPWRWLHLETRHCRPSIRAKRSLQWSVSITAGRVQQAQRAERDGEGVLPAGQTIGECFQSVAEGEAQAVMIALCFDQSVLQGLEKGCPVYNVVRQMVPDRQVAVAVFGASVSDLLSWEACRTATALNFAIEEDGRGGVCWSASCNDFSMIGLTEAMNGGQPLRLLDLAFFPMLFHHGALVRHFIMCESWRVWNIGGVS